MSIPARRLADVCELITKGTTPTTLGYQFAESGVPFLRVQNIDGGGVLVGPDTLFIDQSTHASLQRSQIRGGDILVSIAGTIGRAAIVPDDAAAMNCNQAVAILRATNGVHRPFLRYWLESSSVQHQMRSGTVTGTIANLSLTQLANLSISLPDLPEQRRVATILDKADALRAMRRAAIAQLDELTQSIFLDMFGDPVTNPKGWPVKLFGELGENQDSLRVPVKSSDRAARSGEFAYYGASGIIDWIDDFLFDGRRLLIGEDGANLIARATPIAFIASGKYWVNNHAHVIGENGLAKLEFLAFFINHIDLKSYISGTAQPKLNQYNLARIPVPLPPLKEQEEFCRRLEAVASMQRAHEKSISMMDALFASVQHDAFQGRL